MAGNPPRASDADKKKASKKETADPGTLLRSKKGAEIDLTEEELRRVVGAAAKKG